MKKIILRFLAVVAAAFLSFACVSKEPVLADAPFITSASYQHTQYNGRNQPVEVKAAKEDAPPFMVTYFKSQEDGERGLNGSTEPPVEVGDYYVRIERPGGNGYRQGNPLTIEYHIQKAFITIVADPVQPYLYDGKPKAIKAAADPPVDPPLVISYFAPGTSAALLSPLPFPPREKGVYRATVVFPGNERYMGASKDIELRIE